MCFNMALHKLNLEMLDGLSGQIFYFNTSILLKALELY